MKKEQIQESLTKLNELLASITAIKDKKQIKADDMGAPSQEAPETESEKEDEGCECCDCCEELKYKVDSIVGYVEYLNSRISEMYSYISSVESALYDHKNNGHLPKINSAEQMQVAVTKLGLDGEYNVEKKTIYASNTKVIDFSLQLKKQDGITLQEERAGV